MTSLSLARTSTRHGEGEETEFHRGLGLFDSTMIVVGGMIGSGIFIVPAEMSQLLGSPGWLLTLLPLLGQHLVGPNVDMLQVPPQFELKGFKSFGSRSLLWVAKFNTDA